jgi:hypothetical protein
MVKKQVDIPESQDQALLRQARDLGVSESELIHLALETFLRGGAQAPGTERQEVLEGVLEQAQLAAKEHHLPGGYRFNRDDAV